MRTVAGSTDHVVVVGAGLAGLAAALHLAGRGRQVTVVEREPWPGGRAGRLDIDGYRFDTGPTVLTMPDIIDDAFAAVGETLADRLDLLPVDPAYRAAFADGSALDVHTDADAMADGDRAVRRTARGRRLPAAARVADRAVPRRDSTDSSTQNFDSPLSLADAEPGAAAAIGGFRRLGHHGAAATSPTSGCGGCSPSRRCTPGWRRSDALAAYAVIAYMDTVAGVYFPGGGMRALSRQRWPPRPPTPASQFRYGEKVTERRAHRRPRRRRPHRPTGRAHRRRRRGADHRPAAPTYSLLGRRPAARGGAAAFAVGGGRCTSVAAASPPAPRTTRSPSAPPGTRRSRDHPRRTTDE